MNSKTLIIYNSPILFEILNEIKKNLKFDIENVDIKDFESLDFNDFENYAIISSQPNTIKDCYVIDTPSKIIKVKEKINALFISNQFSKQSHLKIGKYNLDLNSRKISNGHISLNLTEKETQIILFINLKKSVSLRELQVEVWQHSSNLETHTVETHIYRLRKKILETIKDENFIKHDKKGYYLN